MANRNVFFFFFLSKNQVAFIRGGIFIKVNMVYINRIYYHSSMQTEKSQPDGKRIMVERGLLSFQHYLCT